MRRLILLCLTLVTACDPQARTNADSAPAIRGAVAADQPHARSVGEAILNSGGNAVDAALATLFALAVENPASSGIGGGGFAVIWDAESRSAYALDFRETAPSSAIPDSYYDEGRRFDPARSLRGCSAVGVPGMVAGAAALHGRFGRLAWREIVLPAANLAASGFSVSPYLAQQIRQNAGAIDADLSLGSFLLPQGKPLTAGETIRDPELATTLERIARGGVADFYRGATARSIAGSCEHAPTAVGVDDLRAYEVLWRRPVTGRWRGYDVVSIPAPSAGGTLLLQMLRVVEPIGFDRREQDSERAYHLLAEVMKHAFADRATYFGDPQFVPIDTEPLRSARYAEEIRDSIDLSRTKPPWAYGHPGLNVVEDGGTTHVSAVDSRGSAIAITSSLNGPFGAFVRTDTGILLNNTLDDFSFPEQKGGSASTGAGAQPNYFELVGSKKNEIAPGKRPVSSMTPTIVLDRGRVRMVAGGSGGPRILTGTFQTILGVLAEHRSVDDAVNSPRVHHQWKPNRLLVEPGIPSSVMNGLRERGHDVSTENMLGVVNALAVEGDTATAAIDARKETPKESR